MKYTPQTEEEVLSTGSLEGVFDFEILDAKEYTSNAGNETFELKLNVFDTEGTPRPRKDWVTPAFAKKFKHLHDACSLDDKYQSGTTIASDFVGKTGKLKMAKRKYTNKDGLEMIGDQVEDYIKRDNTSTYRKAASDPLEGDEIPF